MWQHAGNLWRWQLPQAPEIWAAVTTRQGGQSPPPWDSLNWGWAVGDQASRVQHHHDQVYRAAGLAHCQVVEAEQVHGAQVAVIDDDQVTRAVATDALLTSRPDTVLSMVYADCVPVLMAVPTTGWVGVVHAGWRGTALNVVGRAVASLVAHGASAATVWAGIGPSIGGCCYEVDRPVYEAIGGQLGSQGVFRPAARPDHWYLDLAAANQSLLERAGVSPACIEIAGVCTACHPQWFFSFRRDQTRTGRMGGLICRLSETMWQES